MSFYMILNSSIRFGEYTQGKNLLLAEIPPYRGMGQ